MPRIILPCLFAFSLILGACSDAPERHHRGAEMMGPPLPAMSGTETFAGEQLLVEATIGQGYGQNGRGGPGGPGGGRRGGERRSWRQHEDSEMGGGGLEGGEMDRGEFRPHMQESHMPPVVIQLHATNKGTDPIEITWVECNSALGNFGVLPEKMTVAPGATVDTENMRSLLGASGEDIPVTVTMKVRGKTEKKTITVRAKPEPAAPAVPVRS